MTNLSKTASAMTCAPGILQNEEAIHGRADHRDAEDKARPVVVRAGRSPDDAAVAAIIGGVIASHSSGPAPAEPELPYGPDTGKAGFVWRELYSGDVVCISGTGREQLCRENRDGPGHSVVS